MTLKRIYKSPGVAVDVVSGFHAVRDDDGSAGKQSQQGYPRCSETKAFQFRSNIFNIVKVWK